MRKTFLALSLVTLLAAAAAGEDSTTRKLRQNLRAMDPAVRAQALSMLTYDRPKSIPPELVAVVVEALQKDPADSVKEAANGLLLSWLEAGLSAESRKRIAPIMEKALEGPAPLPAALALLLFLEGETRLTQAELLKAPLEALRSDDPYLAKDMLTRCAILDYRIARTLLVDWQKDPKSQELLNVLAESAVAQPAVARGIQSAMLERLASPDADLALSAWNYFSKSQLAEPVRAALLERIRAVEGESRLPACRALYRGLQEPAPLVDWLRTRLGSKSSEEKAEAALVLLEEKGLHEILKSELARVVAQPEFGQRVLLEVATSGRLPAARLKEVGQLIRTASDLSLLYSLSRVPGASALIPDLKARLKQDKDGSNRILLCTSLQNLGEMAATLAPLQQLAAGPDGDLASSAVLLLAENPLMLSKELAALARRRGQCRTLASVIDRRPSLVWQEQLGLLQQALKESPEAASTTYYALQGKEHWPGSRALLEKLYAGASNDLKLSLAQSLWNAYRDRRVVGLLLQQMGGETLSSAISAASTLGDELTEAEKARLLEALRQAAPEANGYSAAALLELLWKLGQDPKDLLPRVFDPEVSDMGLLDQLPLDRLAAAMGPEDVQALGGLLETLAAAPQPEASQIRQFVHLARLYVLAYPKTQSLTPLLGKLQGSSSPLLAKLARGALEQVAP
jgi:hypothetical protein